MSQNGEKIYSVFNLQNIKDVAPYKTKEFTFNYNNERVFWLKAENEQEWNSWVDAIEFLCKIGQAFRDWMSQEFPNQDNGFSVEETKVESWRP